MKQSLLSKIPSVNSILMSDCIKKLLSNYPEITVKEAIKRELDELKNDILNLNIDEFNTYKLPELSTILNNIVKEVEKEDKFSLKKVINATGTILHTNLGRSVLSKKIKNNIIDIGFNYSNLEFDIENKKRGSRYSHLVKIIKKITKAEDVIVVNNNAAAVMLTLNSLVQNKEVIVSRGELVEIGGSFRIPEIIKLSGCKLQEVGTTNKTHLKDYTNAINEETGALLKVHTSNYKIVGFTENVDNFSIAKISKERNLISISDLGSGQLIDLRKFGLPYEPTVQEVLKSGIDVVMFSGDKLLGGLQAGIIVGKKKYIEKIKKNQLTRVLRVDKLTIAGLEATFRLYLNEKEVIYDIPTLRMISYNKNDLVNKANIFLNKIDKSKYNCEILTNDKAEIGGGSFPGFYLDSVSVKLTHLYKNSIEIEKKLRCSEIPTIVRIKDNSIILDMRTLDESDFDTVLSYLSNI